MDSGYGELHNRIIAWRTPIVVGVLAVATASHLFAHLFLARSEILQEITAGIEVLIYGVGVAAATWILLGWLARSVERTEYANEARYQAAESLRFRSQQIEALHSASRLLSRSRDVTTVAEPVVELAGRIAGACCGAMILYLERERSRPFAALWYDPEAPRDTDVQYDAGQLLAEPCVTCPDAKQCKFPPETLCFPIRAGAELLGVLRLAGAMRTGATTRRTLETLASEIVAVVWGQQAEHRAIEAVRSLGRDASNSDDLADIPQRFLGAVCGSLGAASATLYRLGETPEPVARAGTGVPAPRTLPHQATPGNAVWTEDEGRRIYARGGDLGLIALEFTARPQGSSPAMQLLEFVAVQADSLLGIAEVLNRLAWRERRRLADELHDGAAQTLAFAHLRTSAGLHALQGGKTNELEVALEEIREATLEAYDEVRSAIDGLRAAPRPGESDGAFIRRVVNSFAERGGDDVSVAMPAGLSCQPHALAGVIRIVQEALANAFRHGGASRVAVRITIGDTGSCVEISDDGVGFDGLDANRTGHYGIAMMRERAAVLGGRILIDSAPGKGCTVRLHLPHGILASGGDVQDVGLTS